MVAIKTKNSNRSTVIHVAGVRTFVDPRAKSTKAAIRAARIADRLAAGDLSPDTPSEGDLFRTLQTAAFRSTRPGGGKRGAARREAWERRWRLLRNIIVERNMGLVWCMVGQFGSANVDREEQGSAAMMTLLKAVDAFNPWLGFRFSTYACNAIRRALILLSRTANRNRGLFPVEYDELFERPESGDGELELYVDRVHQVLHDNLGELSDREASIVAWRFPMDGSPGMTLGEIGDVLGLSKERVRQIQKSALGKLRTVLEADPLLQ